MRVIVTGSRDWTDRYAVYRALAGVCDEFGLWLPPCNYGNRLPSRRLVVVHGACPTGADAHADDWCLSEWLPAERHPADWEKHGKAAGFLRNKEMVALGADVVLAFQRKASRGTQHTINLARKAGIEVRVTEET